MALFSSLTHKTWARYAFGQVLHHCFNACLSLTLPGPFVLSLEYLQAVTTRKEGVQKFWPLFSSVSPSTSAKNCPSLWHSYKPLWKWCLCWGSSWLPFPRRKGCVPRSVARQGWKPPSETSFIIAEDSNKGHIHVTGSPECRGIAGGGECSARVLLTHLSPRE